MTNTTAGNRPVDRGSAPDAAPLGALPPAGAGPAFDLLDGVRILDLTTSVAGPFATMLLADLGASVIKVERPGAGDDARGWGPPFLDGESLWFLAVNRNKQSVTLDYSGPEGRRCCTTSCAAATRCCSTSRRGWPASSGSIPTASGRSSPTSSTPRSPASA